MLHDPKHLWSPYGLRSLSASHPESGQGENYWKGPIWIQMNYLALRALYMVRHPSFDVDYRVFLTWGCLFFSFAKTYAKEEGPYQEHAKEIYGELRRNIVDNVFKVCCFGSFRTA